jgi:poly-gamma-glutamate synthase PgsB/CapB
MLVGACFRGGRPAGGLDRAMTLILLILAAALAVYGAETLRHRAILARLPARIHVNGTRGKSSVTRLIAYGLRAGGLRVFAKTTGSAAQMLHVDGTEEPVVRNSPPNIREQLAVMHRAAREKAEVLVIECMAVRPDLQRIAEKRIVKSTLGVITNIRPDHLEVMGPRLEDVAIALSSTTPTSGKLFSTEARFASFLAQKAAARGSTFHLTTPEHWPSREEMEGFPYVEIPENVALALDVCAAAGVDRGTALKGMYKAVPDIGVTTRTVFRRGDKKLVFVNVFAANDKESIVMLWRMLGLDRPGDLQVGVLINNRGDRMRRAMDMAEICARDLAADWYLAAGDQTAAFIDMCVRMKIPRDKMINLGGVNAQNALDRMFELTQRECTVMGIGNIGGFGIPFTAMLDEERRRQPREARALDERDPAGPGRGGRGEKA